jgi:hypothetical protein
MVFLPSRLEAKLSNVKVWRSETPLNSHKAQRDNRGTDQPEEKSAYRWVNIGHKHRHSERGEMLPAIKFTKKAQRSTYRYIIQLRREKYLQVREIS